MKKKHAAFSLVEAVLALGIVSFALSSVLVLLPVAMDSGKASRDDTLLVTMAGDLLSSLQSRRFIISSDSSQQARQDLLDGTDDVAAGAAPEKVVVELYFDVAGRLLRGANGAPLNQSDAMKEGAIYRCRQTVQGDVETLGPPGANSTQAVNLVRVELDFQWPLMATKPMNRKVIYASIARY